VGGIAVTVSDTSPASGFWIELAPGGGELPNVIASAPGFVDLSGTAEDVYIIPSVAHVIYRVDGVDIAAGTYSGTGTVVVTAAAETGYALIGTSSWSFTFTAVTNDPYIFDTFTAADGTQLTGRTTDVVGAATTKVWGGTASALTIQTNQAAPASASNAATLNTGLASYKLTVTAVIPNSAITVLLRYQDADNYVYFQWRAATDNWALLKRVAGTNVLIHDTGEAPANGDVLEIIVNGSSYSMKVNSGTQATATEAFLATNTVIGFRGGLVGGRWDNLKIFTI
jgi:hypothetical protein